MSAAMLRTTWHTRIQYCRLFVGNRSIVLQLVVLLEASNQRFDLASDFRGLPAMQPSRTSFFSITILYSLYMQYTCMLNTVGLSAGCICMPVCMQVCMTCTYIHTYVGLLQHRGYIQEAIVYTCPMKVVQYQ